MNLLNSYWTYIVFHKIINIKEEYIERINIDQLTNLKSGNYFLMIDKDIYKIK